MAIDRVPIPGERAREKLRARARRSARALKDRLRTMAAEQIDVPCIIGGKEMRSGTTAQSVMPHNHRHVLADWHKATSADVDAAIAASREAQHDWANWAWEDRAAVFLKAAELLTTT